MSATSAVRAPRARAGAAPTWRPVLRIVRAPAPARTLLPFILLCMVILGSALLGTLALNTAMAATAYDIHDRQAELSRLAESEQALTEQVEGMAAPAALAARATEIGMVPAEGMNYIVLEEGSIRGPAAGLVEETGLGGEG